MINLQKKIAGAIIAFMVAGLIIFSTKKDLPAEDLSGGLDCGSSGISTVATGSDYTSYNTGWQSVSDWVASGSSSEKENSDVSAPAAGTAPAAAPAIEAQTNTEWANWGDSVVTNNNWNGFTNNIPVDRSDMFLDSSNNLFAKQMGITFAPLLLTVTPNLNFDTTVSFVPGTPFSTGIGTTVSTEPGTTVSTEPKTTVATVPETGTSFAYLTSMSEQGVKDLLNGKTMTGLNSEDLKLAQAALARVSSFVNQTQEFFITTPEKVDFKVVETSQSSFGSSAITDKDTGITMVYLEEPFLEQIKQADNPELSLSKVLASDFSSGTYEQNQKSAANFEKCDLLDNLLGKDTVTTAIQGNGLAFLFGLFSMPDSGLKNFADSFQQVSDAFKQAGACDIPAGMGKAFEDNPLGFVQGINDVSGMNKSNFTNGFNLLTDAFTQSGVCDVAGVVVSAFETNPKGFVQAIQQASEMDPCTFKCTFAGVVDIFKEGKGDKALDEVAGVFKNYPAEFVESLNSISKMGIADFKGLAEFLGPGNMAYIFENFQNYCHLCSSLSSVSEMGLGNFKNTFNALVDIFQQAGISDARERISKAFAQNPVDLSWAIERLSQSGPDNFKKSFDGLVQKFSGAGETNVAERMLAVFEKNPTFFTSAVADTEKLAVIFQGSGIDLGWKELFSAFEKNPQELSQVYNRIMVFGENNFKELVGLLGGENVSAAFKKDLAGFEQALNTFSYTEIDNLKAAFNKVVDIFKQAGFDNPVERVQAVFSRDPESFARALWQIYIGDATHSNAPDVNAISVQEVVDLIGADKFASAFETDPWMISRAMAHDETGEGEGAHLTGIFWMTKAEAAEFKSSIESLKKDYPFLFDTNGIINKQYLGKETILDKPLDLPKAMNAIHNTQQIKLYLLSVLYTMQNDFSTFNKEEYNATQFLILGNGSFIDVDNAFSDFNIGFAFTSVKEVFVATLAHEITHNFVHYNHPDMNKTPIGEFTADLGAFALLEKMGLKDSIPEVQARFKYQDAATQQSDTANKQDLEIHAVARDQITKISQELESIGIPMNWEAAYQVSMNLVKTLPEETSFDDFSSAFMNDYLQETFGGSFKTKVSDRLSTIKQHMSEAGFIVNPPVY